MPSQIMNYTKLVAAVSIWLSSFSRNKAFIDMEIGAAAGALVAQNKSDYHMTFTAMYARAGRRLRERLVRT